MHGTIIGRNLLNSDHADYRPIITPHRGQGVIIRKSLVRGAVVDMDPITPGIQTNPGLVTATGPTVIIGHI